ncbi:hypothetical protein SCHPADRAFT_889747 [Schizopora paradoxa]|uniref:Protein kinase domain-containing protein n=1 Tax=Schizopora paradoxa TaxID=27342 RepID=A0A0H2RPE0_9AGAM|nr:hypothetical protein SCHPADRAFT_889747 [Schizopora paradoxa]
MYEKKDPRFKRALNVTQAAQFRRDTEAGKYDLSESEKWWRDRNQILEDHGYELRPRLKPDWTPSWNGTDRDPRWCEDKLNSHDRKVIDAVRKSDGIDVALMNIQRTSHERDVFQHLADAQRASGKDHHVVQLLDSFEDEREPNLVFLVMPRLHDFEWPPFEYVSELVDLFRHLLEALVFMHSKNVAHRDCSLGNIMMDAPSMFPNGVHPCDFTRDRTGEERVRIIPRHKASGPINYYFIDFGISRLYEEDEAHLVVGNDGADQDIPEMSDIDEYDPFPADVFLLGNVFKKYFIPMYKNIDFLSPLANAMTAEKPEDRPTAADAQKQLQTLISSLGFFTLRHRLIKTEDEKAPKPIVLENVGILLSCAFYPIKVAIRLPSQTLGAVRDFITSRASKKKTA